MATVTATTLSLSDSLEQFREQFNNLQSDVGGITLTSLSTGGIIFEGSTADEHETTLNVVDPTGDRTVLLPNASTTLVGTDTTDTLTNKTLTSAVVATSLDLNGSELILDVDADTSITADTDDQIDFRLGGADLVTFTPGVIDLKNAGSVSNIKFYCESSNAHYAQLQSSAHADYSGNVTITLPVTSTTLIGASTTDTLTNKTISGNLPFSTDGAQINFCANSEITLKHVHDTGLTITNTINGTDDRPVVLQLKSEEDAIVADDVIASIELAAGDSDGTDGATVAAGIHAIAEGTFSASANATKLVFTTGVSETAAASATAKMTLSSAGLLTIADDFMIKDGGTIGVASANDAMTISSAGIVTFKDDIVLKNDGTIGSAGVAGAITIASDGVVTFADDIVIKDSGTIGSASDTDAISIASNGVVSFTQAVSGTSATFDSGVAIDNITIDGTEIDLSSGDLTLDVAGDIVLDAGGDEVIFKDGSTNVGHVSLDSDNLTFKSLVNDKDMIFKGVDGSSEITALTFDMSAAGLATFNAGVTTGGNIIIPDAGTIGSASDTDAIAIDSSGNVTISQSLTVNGATVTNSATNTTIEDQLIELGTGRSGSASGDAGIVIERGDDANVFIGWDESEDRIVLGTGTFTGASSGNLSITNAGVTAASLLVSDAGTIGSASDTDAIAIGSDGDVTLTQDLELQHDGATIAFGANDEITVTHVHDVGLTVTNTINGSDGKPVILQLKSEEDAIVADDVIASIELAAGDSDGTDAAVVAAGIHAIAEGTFAADANATKLVFTTGVSETAAASATAKMTLSSAGLLTIADDLMIKDGGTIGVASTNDALTISSAGLLTVKDDLVIKSGGTIGGAADTDLLTLGSAALTVAGTLGATAITASGRLITDDTTEATSTTDGALQTDGGLSVALDIVAGDDIKLLSDASLISFGTNSEITLTHVHDVGLTITNTVNGTDDRPIVLQLKSEEDAIVADDVIASIEMAAGDSDGTDAAVVAAGIHAIAEGAFTASANATKLVFTTGVSESAAASAAAKMSLSSRGALSAESGKAEFGGDFIVLNSTDGTANAGDNIIIEDGGTDGSGTNAGDNMLYEYYTSFTNSQLLIKDAAGNVLKAIYGVGGKL